MKTGIIKTVKTNRYTQIHNEVVQKKLTKLESIGVLTYLLSLPEDWVIRKTDLQNRFGKASVNHAFTELEATGFLASFIFRNGQRNEYAYAVTDIEFSKEQIKNMIIETDLPFMSVKCSYPELNEELKSLATPNFSQKPNFKSSASAVELEKLNVKNSETPTTKESVSKKTQTNNNSSSIDKRIEIDMELKEKYADKPFDEIRDLLLTDESVIIKTDRQYKALLTYRLENYSPKSKKETPAAKRAPKKQKTEKVPDWYDAHKAQRAAEDAQRKAEKEAKEENEEDFEALRARLLAKLHS